MWTKPEIDEYLAKAREYEPLRLLYEKAGMDSIQDRAKYLAETVLKLTMSDQDMVMRHTNEKGRPAGLLLLEDMVIAEHQDEISRLSKEINVQY